jgi:hypothetical protein
LPVFLLNQTRQHLLTFFDSVEEDRKRFLAPTFPIFA